jgi:hypothetical protein
MCYRRKTTVERLYTVAPADADPEVKGLPFFGLITITLLHWGFLMLPHAPQWSFFCNTFNDLDSSWRNRLCTIVIKPKKGKPLTSGSASAGATVYKCLRCRQRTVLPQRKSRNPNSKIPSRAATVASARGSTPVRVDVKGSTQMSAVGHVVWRLKELEDHLVFLLWPSSCCFDCHLP